MPTAEVEIEIYCADCGEGLCNQSSFHITNNRRQPSFRVEACKKCLSRAEDSGFQKGYDEANKECEERVK